MLVPVCHWHIHNGGRHVYCVQLQSAALSMISRRCYTSVAVFVKLGTACKDPELHTEFVACLPAVTVASRHPQATVKRRAAATAARATQQQQQQQMATPALAARPRYQAAAQQCWGLVMR
jgi:hypothetical protein